jgi:hypothetical protein
MIPIKQDEVSREAAGLNVRRDFCACGDLPEATFKDLPINVPMFVAGVAVLGEIRPWGAEHFIRLE